MNNALSLDVVSLADTIRDKVRTTIAASIPDSQLDALVKKEWETFFTVPTPKNNWETNVEFSPFQAMVRKEIDTYINQKVQEAVKKELDAFSQSVWDNQGKRVVSEVVKAYAPSALEGMAATVTQTVLERMNQNRY